MDLESVGRRLPIARREAKLSIDPLPVRVLVGQERLGNRPQAPGEEPEGGHRRLDEAVLQSADVRLRVARLRELALGQAGPGAGCLESDADLASEVPVLGGKARPGPSADGGVHVGIIRPDSRGS